MGPSYAFPETIEGQLSGVRHGRWIGVAVLDVRYRKDWNKVELACIDGHMLDLLRARGPGEVFASVVPEVHKVFAWVPDGVSGWGGRSLRVMPRVRMMKEHAVRLEISNPKRCLEIDVPVGHTVWVNPVGGAKVVPDRLMTKKGALCAKAQRAFSAMYPSAWDAVVSPWPGAVLAF